MNRCETGARLRHLLDQLQPAATELLDLLATLEADEATFGYMRRMDLHSNGRDLADALNYLERFAAKLTSSRGRNRYDYPETEFDKAPF